MSTLLISASSRDNSESLRITHWLNEHCLNKQAQILDLFSSALPPWNGKNFDHATVKQLRSQLRQADSFVFVVPEWNGMAPAALKNLFLWFSHREFAHKPALLVAVSAGDGGAFVVSELRSSSYKNSRLLYLPEHVILRNVESLWSQARNSSDDYLGQRLRNAVEMLREYSNALLPIRARLLTQLSDHANGMS